MSLLIIAFDAEEAALCAGFAQSYGQPFDILQLTGDAVTDQGAGKVMLAGLPSLPPADFLANAIQALPSTYSAYAAVSSMRAKDVLPRLAALKNGAMATDVIEVIDEKTFIRPVVAGSVLAKVQLSGEPIVVTFRPASFPASQPGGTSTVEQVKLAFRGKTKRVSESARSGGGRPDLSQAKVVVSGGRPLKDAETFERLIGGLADKLGGAVGATRAAVDSGIAANELQVGQTGKIVAPDLYIAAGISGSTQHMAGIKDSKIIVAINIDPDAPIFDTADFGLVADLYVAIPELMEKL